MRPKSQIEQTDAVTAAIFNSLHPNGEPAENYYELTDEGCTEADREQWRMIEKAVSELPPDAVAGLSSLLQDLNSAKQQGYVRGLVFAARIAHRRWQDEQARDLLIEADITSWEALQASSAEADDIYGCRDLFKDWSPSKEQVWASRRRSRATPASLLVLQDLPKTAQQATE